MNTLPSAIIRVANEKYRTPNEMYRNINKQLAAYVMLHLHLADFERRRIFGQHSSYVSHAASIHVALKVDSLSV